jgi:PAS domain S-box-containing protein
MAVGWLLRGHSDTLLWFRITALLVPPLAGVVVIVRRRHVWTGCQWLFWATIALGLMMSAIGLIGWTVDELLLGHETTWLGWYTVFALFGAVAPLVALLTQPHRGSREAVTASTAVDIAGIAVMAGFLYSRFVITPDVASAAARVPLSLVLLSEFQQVVVVAGMIVATLVARDPRWAATYRRLAIGLIVNAVILTIANLGIWNGLYRSGFVYDVIWILPYAFFPWAASQAPPSADIGTDDTDRQPLTPSRPWIVFSALGLIPLLDYGLRQVLPLGQLEGFRDLSTAITVVSVLPLLMARLAVEHGEARQADRKGRLLAAATEHAEEFISIIRPDGTMEHANAAFCAAAGFTPKEVSRMQAAEFLAEQSRSQVRTIRDAVQSDGVWRGTLVRCRRDGSAFLTSCTVTALADDAGRLTQLVAVERDITRETELRDQLIHSERLAAAGQLVSGVAHELNNPLQSVVGFTELVLEGERRQDARADLERVLAEAHRAARIVRNLLAFVRRSSAERAPAGLNDLVRDAVALRSYELGVANIVVHTAYAADLPAVRVDREEIQQVLLNLLLNAEHALKTGGGRGELRVRTLLHEDGVAIEIHDTGPGVPASVAGRIFEPFFSTKEVGQGTGLGLSIALGIVKAHGGSLTLATEAQGACFRLTLPATEGSPAEARERPAPPARYAMAGQRALVADDEEPVRSLLQRSLTRRGFVVDLAFDGEMAAQLLERNQYDVILCDVKMPNGGGLALYDSIRQRRSELLDRFVFISGDILNAQLHWLNDSSHVPLLTKPFDAAKLDDVLQQVVARRFGTRTVAAAHLDPIGVPSLARGERRAALMDS